MLIVFAAFTLLSLATLLSERERRAALSRTRDEWLVDGLGLVAQGALVPLLQLTLVYGALAALAPGLRGSLALPGWAAFALNFAGVDYLYYWNHRAMHTPRGWRAHAVHHSGSQLDVLASSRNTLWTPLVIVYLWANGALAFLLADPAPFLLAASVTAALDLWRHTAFGPRPGSALHRALSRVLITPHEHRWHHSDRWQAVNFGANLSLWDRLHGTWLSPADAPARIGIPLRLPLRRKLLAP